MSISKNGQLGIGLINPTASLQISNSTNLYGIRVDNTFGSGIYHAGVYSSSIIKDDNGYGLVAVDGYTGTYLQ